MLRADQRTRIQPITLGTIFNQAIAGNTDFFATDLVPTKSPTAFLIYATFDTLGILNVIRTRAGVPITEQLNLGQNLTANSAYLFEILVHDNDTTNLQFSVGTQILYCIVIETPWVVG